MTVLFSKVGAQIQLLHSCFCHCLDKRLWVWTIWYSCHACGLLIHHEIFAAYFSIVLMVYLSFSFLSWNQLFTRHFISMFPIKQLGIETNFFFFFFDEQKKGFNANDHWVSPLELAVLMAWGTPGVLELSMSWHSIFVKCTTRIRQLLDPQV